MQQFTDRAAWESAVGPYKTIDFTGGASGVDISNDYAESHGVTFAATARYEFYPFFYANDDWGMQAETNAWIVFAEPQRWIAADHPRFIRFQLYSQGSFIYDSGYMGNATFEVFSGLFSSQPFDLVRLTQPSPNLPVRVDDLYFGIPSPGALGVFALAGLFARRRRYCRR